MFFWIFALVISPAIMSVIGYSPMSLLFSFLVLLPIKMFLDPEKPNSWRWKNIWRALNEPDPPKPPSKANWKLVDDARTQWEMERKYGKRIV
jgi:hypothetical protein